MATLCVKNVPDDRYEALRRQAKRNHRSIRAEFLELLQTHFTSGSLPSKLAKRKTSLRPVAGD
jgi:plasmid stability protein